MRETEGSERTIFGGDKSRATWEISLTGAVRKGQEDGSDGTNDVRFP